MRCFSVLEMDDVCVIVLQVKVKPEESSLPHLVSSGGIQYQSNTKTKCLKKEKKTKRYLNIKNILFYCRAYVFNSVMVFITNT